MEYKMDDDERAFEAAIDNVRACVERFENMQWDQSSLAAFVAELVEIVNLADDTFPPAC